MRGAAQRGFSLIELIVVIVLLGLLAVGGGLLILRPIEAYDDQVRRQQLVDQGEMALRQIARDIRRALPNSIRIAPFGAGFAVEMVNTVDGARYRDEIGGVDYVNPTDVLDFISADQEFNFLGRLGNVTPAQITNMRIVIYNTSPPNIYAEAVDLSDFEGIITRGDMTIALTTPNPGPDDDEDHIVLSAPFRFTQQSPGQRAFIVDGPISYICDPATSRIRRYSGYAYSAAQPTPPVGGTNAVLVTRLSGCNMTYTAGTSQRGGILSVEITIDDSGEAINLLHQIHVVNVP